MLNIILRVPARWVPAHFLKTFGARTDDVCRHDANNVQAGI